MPQLINLRTRYSRDRRFAIPAYRVARLWQAAKSLPEDIRLLLTSKHRARYIGYVGFGNLGDEAVCRAIRILFADQVEFHTGMQVGPILNLLGSRVNLGSVFLGGGTLIKGPSMHMKRVNAFLDKYPHSKFIVFGTGVGDADLWESLGFPTDKDNWCRLLDLGAYLAVRGPISKEFLQNWGVSREVRVIGDPCILFARDSVVPKGRTKRIGINLGPSNGLIIGRNERYVLEFGSRLLRLLTAQGWHVTLFPVTQADTYYMREAAKMAGIAQPAIHTGFQNLDATLSAMERQDVFLGEKLHSVILASCVYTPAIMLEYRTKCRDFMKSIGREEWTYRTDNLDIDLIYGRLSELYDGVDEHQSHIFDRMQHWKAVLHLAAAEVKRILHTTDPL